MLLKQSKDKLITDYVVFEKNRSDQERLPVVMERHEEKYGRRPESIAAAMGLCPDAQTYEELEEGRTDTQRLRKVLLGWVISQ